MRHLFSSSDDHSKSIVLKAGQRTELTEAAEGQKQK